MVVGVFLLGLLRSQALRLSHLLLLDRKHSLVSRPSIVIRLNGGGIGILRIVSLSSSMSSSGDGGGSIRSLNGCVIGRRTTKCKVKVSMLCAIE